MARGRKKRLRRDEPTRHTPDREAQDIEQLREENNRLRQLLEEYAKRIADLERQLALKQQNSTLTSKPPSSDGLAGRQRERGRRVKRRRKAGGQPGHPGHHRALALLKSPCAAQQHEARVANPVSGTPPLAARGLPHCSTVVAASPHQADVRSHRHVECDANANGSDAAYAARRS